MPISLLPMTTGFNSLELSLDAARIDVEHVQAQFRSLRDGDEHSVSLEDSVIVQEAKCEPSAVPGAGLDSRIYAVETDVRSFFHSLRARDERSVSSEDAVTVEAAKC